MGNVILTADIGFGDTGKGSIVDWLVRENRSTLVVRYNGGAQAAHNVVLDDGRHHTFAQFGSGSLCGAGTFLSKDVIIAPDLFLNEASHLRDLGVSNPESLVHVDKDCAIATPFHRAANHAREIARGNHAHGSCGLGIGEARADVETGREVLCAGDLLDTRKTKEKLLGIRADKRLLCDELSYKDNTLSSDDILQQVIDYYTMFASRVHLVDTDFISKELALSGTIIFEGAHGVLLDQTYGFFPHVTRSDTTFRHANELLDECGHEGRRYRLGITRCFSTRHGAGPFPAESQRVARWFVDQHDQSGRWQGTMRYGWFDALMARYGVAALGGIDGIAVTCLDRLRYMPNAKIVDAYSGAADATRFEIGRDGLATDIIVQSRPSLENQQQLARALHLVEPLTYAVRTDMIVEDICDALAIRPYILSFGPTADDKSYDLTATHSTLMRTAFGNLHPCG